MKWTIADQQTDIIIVPVFEQHEEIAPLQELHLQDHMLKKNAATWFYGRAGQPHVLVIGLGKIDQFQLETLRNVAGVAGREMQRGSGQNAGVTLAGLEQWIQGDQERRKQVIEAWTEGTILGTYRFDKYKREQEKSSLQEVIYLLPHEEELEEAIVRGKRRAEGVVISRNLANEPPNALRPADLTARIERIFADTNVQINVYQGSELEAKNMQGIIAVGKGSKHPPAFVEMRYCTDETKPLIALIGKGMTFDTGGISLKKARDLSDMRFDMAGAAAVVGAMHILSQSGVKANVVALVATAENMPDGGSLLPGEVITYANGLSVQVGNTDAEGRLILADALIYAHQLGAVEAVDIATLTGACAVSLGTRIAGLWGDEEVVQTIQHASHSSGDKVWPMPLEDEYEELLKSNYADMNNISTGPYAGAITAALFLRRFVHETMKWAHIDMAGPMEATGTKGYIPAGATGFGARLLADYIVRRIESSQ